jgi:hypothetical protein
MPRFVRSVLSREALANSHAQAPSGVIGWTGMERQEVLALPGDSRQLLGIRTLVKWQVWAYFLR